MCHYYLPFEKNAVLNKIESLLPTIGLWQIWLKLDEWFFIWRIIKIYLSPIYFIKIRLPDFLCKEFLIKMYGLLQNYTFEICTLSKIMNFVVNTIFFIGRSLFTSDRKVDTWFRTLVHWFATVLSFWHGFHFHC